MFDGRDPHPWLAQLNDEQRAAATHPGGPLLILAGAGTGKTTTLCARVAWLLAQGVAAERILLLTFTRRAAREMVERSRALTDRVVPNGGRVLGGTFHSVAHRLVRLHASSLGLAPGFGVLDAGDAADLLDLVRQEHGQAGRRRRFPRAQTMLDIYSRTVNAQTPLTDVLAESFPWCEEHRDALAEIFRAYGARKRSLGLLDLDDLLLHWRALAADEVIGPRMAAAFDHVLVDEYQDVNGLQVDIVRCLCPVGPGLTVVGDDLQAIYGFRAASARHILDFPAQFAGSEMVTLERNYRSTAPILAVANAVSRQDRLGFPKELWTERDGGRPPELVFPRDEGEQAGEVCDRVLAAREEGMELRAQAVLFRTGHDSDLLELELTRRGIPFVKYGGLRYLDAAHVKDLIALLRLTDNPADEVSWFRLLQLLDGVGPIRARRGLDAVTAGAVTVPVCWAVGRPRLMPPAPNRPWYPKNRAIATNAAITSMTILDWPRLGGSAVEAGSSGSGGSTSLKLVESPSDGPSRSRECWESAGGTACSAPLAKALGLPPSAPAAEPAPAEALPNASAVATPAAAALWGTDGVAVDSTPSGCSADSDGQKTSVVPPDGSLA